MDAITKDKRFSHIHKDPRFRSVPHQERKTKIDKRFQSMFHDERFKLKYSVDKRGKKVNISTDENLRKYYELSDSEESESDDLQDSPKYAKKKEKRSSKMVEEKRVNRVNKSTKKDSSSEETDDEEEEESGSDSDSSESDSPKHDVAGGPDLARGEGNIETSDEETDVSSDSSENEESGIDHKWGELDKDVPDAPDVSRRLALCNMNWDRIKASDLFVLLQSFAPTGGSISSIVIYPSDYGLERMKKEAVHGPSEIVEQSVNSDNDKNMEEDEDGNVYSREKLRQYQINRLKYYYAVCECDSPETASHIYANCDGVEYQTSAAKLDLRYIPDDMTFEQDAKESCTNMPDSSIYKPSTFLTTALCQLKVDLTWDETDHERVELTTKKFTEDEVKEDNFKAYLVNSSDEEEVSYGNLLKFGDGDDSESDEDDEKQIDKYRSLLNTIKNEEEKKNDNDVQMEISWEPGLKETTEKIVKKKFETKEDTPWDEYLKKKKEKKKKKKEEKGNKKETEETNLEQEAFSDDELPADMDKNDPFFTEENLNVDEDKKKKKKSKKKKERFEKSDADSEQNKAELALLMMDENEDDKKHFNIKDLMVDSDTTKRKKKKQLRKKKTEVKSVDTFQLNVEDPRFAAIYSSSLFNVDPSAPEFKNTKGMHAIIDEKIKRRKDPKLTKTDSISLKRKNESGQSNELVPKRPKDVPLSALVKTVKANTQKFKNRKR